MKHFFLMALYAGLVAIVFGTIGRQGLRARMLYGGKIFGEFIGVGLLLAWLMYVLF
jgi:hypothetical protein